jgi:hypothetical protein
MRRASGRAWNSRHGDHPTSMTLIFINKKSPFLYMKSIFMQKYEELIAT